MVLHSIHKGVKLKKTIYLLFLFFLFPILAFANEERTNSMNQFKINKTFCFGRMLFKLPEDIAIQVQTYKFAWNTIEQKKQDKEEFQKEINILRDTLNHSKHNIDPNLLKEDITLKNSDRILFYWESKGIRALVDYKGFAWRNGFSYTIHGTVRPDRLLIGQHGLTKILTNLRYRAPDEIPTTPGFCFENGFIADDGKDYQYEEFNMIFGIKSHPDVTFNIFITPKTLLDSPSLLERLKNYKIPDQYKKDWNKVITVLKQEKYDTKYLTGEISADSLFVKEESEDKAHSFRWENQGVYQDDLRPSVVLELDAGHPGHTKSSLSDQEAMELFEEIINNIQPRLIKGQELPQW